MKEIDCRGMSCPMPVVTTKKVLDESGEREFVLIVDNPAARDNVERFVKSQGAVVQTEERKGNYYLRIHKGSSREAALPQKTGRVVVYVNSNLMGVGDERLGSILMRAFLKTLSDLDPKPWRMIFVNSGVQLTAEGSEVLETLKLLANQGVEILSCGTCLDFYGLKETLRVGIVSNMYDIAQSLIDADKIVRP